MGFLTRRSVKGRGIPPAFLFLEVPGMNELSVFVDESGNLGWDSDYYILTLVFHNQSDDISQSITRYEHVLRERGLPDVPFHFVPLTHGNGPFAQMDVKCRSGLLQSFPTLVWHMPFTYTTFVYRKREFEDRSQLENKMRRDLLLFLFDHLDMIAGYGVVKLYYDDGQRLITRVLHAAFEYALGKQVLIYREAHPNDYRLSQLADFVCSVEHSACKFERHEESDTDKRFLGTARDFKKNYLRKLRRHAL